MVRNCTSKRCSHSVHGHSYKIEVEFEATRLDNAQMVMDFGLMKGSIKELIDSMDHCHIIADTESEEYINFFKAHNDRYIITPFNPSAEMLSVFISDSSVTCSRTQSLLTAKVGSKFTRLRCGKRLPAEPRPRSKTSTSSQMTSTSD